MKMMIYYKTKTQYQKEDTTKAIPLRAYVAGGPSSDHMSITVDVNEDWPQSTTPCATLREVTPQLGYDYCLLLV